MSHVNTKDRLLVRDEYIHLKRDLAEEIDQSIENNGGEEMLIQRIDLMHWVYYSRELLHLYDAVIQTLSGMDNTHQIQMNEAVSQRKEQYRQIRRELDRTKREIQEKQDALVALETQLQNCERAITVLQCELRR